MKELLDIQKGERAYFKKLLRKRCLIYVFALLVLPSCFRNKEENNKVNIRVYASTVNGVPVFLRVNEDVLIRKELKPYREMYERVKVFTKPNDPLTIFYKAGERDTTFTYM